MRYLLWGITGAISISAPFLLLYDPYDPWNALIAGTIGGGLFLIVLLVQHFKALPSLTERTVMTAAALLLIAGSLIQVFLQREVSSFQRRSLLETRTRIGSGIIISDKIHESMLPVLRDFHQQSAKEPRSIVEWFHLRYDFAISNGSFNRYPQYPDVPEMPDAVTTVSFSGDSLVRYHCVDTIALGADPHFRNATGHSGKLEFTADLTAAGVRYERLN